MSGRVLIILVSFWAFQVAPNLCVTGLLTHTCDKHASESSGHESSCDADPCAKFVPSVSQTLRATKTELAHQPILAIAPDIFLPCNQRAPHLIALAHPPR